MIPHSHAPRHVYEVPCTYGYRYCRSPDPTCTLLTSSHTHARGRAHTRRRRRLAGRTVQVSDRQCRPRHLVRLAVLCARALCTWARAFTATLHPRRRWRGHSCAFVEAGEGPPILLLHGFAGSAYNAWRSTIPALAQTHRVFALDLLGLGASAQPAEVEYGIELWREQASDFVREKMGGEPPVIIGHSFGSLVALEVAAAPDAPDVRRAAVPSRHCAVPSATHAPVARLHAHAHVTATRPRRDRHATATGACRRHDELRRGAEQQERRQDG